MDTKIKKYARRCQVTAWALMGFAVWHLFFKWLMDTYNFYRGNGFDLVKYTPLPEAMGKVSGGQFGALKSIVDMQPDLSGTWINLASLTKLSWQVRLIGFLCDAVSVGIMIVGFWLFIKLMKQLAKGSLFSIEVIELLNKLAKVIFCFALYVPINRTLLCLLAAFANPVGPRYLSVTIGLSDILTLMASWFFVILTSLMRESRELQSERDLTV